MKKLFIDPSATGTTGACLVSGEKTLAETQITLLKFESKDWKEHFKWIKDLVIVNSVNLIVCETATYISNTSSDIRKLIGLVGAIQVLPYFFSNLKIQTLPSDQTKRLYKKVINKQVGIVGLNYQKGKSWTHNYQKISVHEVDAFLIYWIWRGNNYN